MHLTLLPVARAVGVYDLFVAQRIADPLRSRWYLTEAITQPVELRYEQVNGEPAAAVPETMAVSTGPMPVPMREMRPGH